MYETTPVNKYKVAMWGFVVTTAVFFWLWQTVPPEIITKTHTEYKTVEVVKEVPVDREVIKEVTKEVQVPFEVIKEVTVIKEVPVEIIKEVPGVCPVIEKPTPRRKPVSKRHPVRVCPRHL